MLTFGAAPTLGSGANLELRAGVVAMASDPVGPGYWLAASDGGVFAFGDASFFGSTGSTTLNAPVVGIATTPHGRGYWLVGADGGVFAFGDAAYHGSLAGRPLAAPITAIVGTRRPRLLARRRRRRRVRIRRRRVLRFGAGPDPLAAPSSAPPRPAPATATGSSAPTAACSRSATRFRGAPGCVTARCRRHRHSRSGRGLLDRAPTAASPASTCSPREQRGLQVAARYRQDGRDRRELQRRLLDRARRGRAKSPSTLSSDPFLACTRAHESDSAGGYQAVSAGGTYAARTSSTARPGTARRGSRTVRISSVSIPRPRRPADQDLLALDLFHARNPTVGRSLRRTDLTSGSPIVSVWIRPRARVISRSVPSAITGRGSSTPTPCRGGPTSSAGARRPATSFPPG